MTTLTWILLGMCIVLPLSHVGCVLLGAKLMHWKIGQRMDQALVEAMTAEKDDQRASSEEIPIADVVKGMNPDERTMTTEEIEEERAAMAAASWTL